MALLSAAKSAERIVSKKLHSAIYAAEQASETLERVNNILETLYSIGVKFDLLTEQDFLPIDRDSIYIYRDRFGTQIKRLERVLHTHVFVNEMQSCTEFRVRLGENQVCYALTDEAAEHLPRKYLIEKLCKEMAASLVSQLPSRLNNVNK